MGRQLRLDVPGLICGAVTAGSGFIGVNIAYGSTLAGDVIPVATVHDLVISSNPTYDWVMTARSSSGFTIDWSNTNGNNKEIMYMAVRT